MSDGPNQPIRPWLLLYRKQGQSKWQTAGSYSNKEAAEKAMKRTGIWSAGYEFHVCHREARES